MKDGTTLSLIRQSRRAVLLWAKQNLAGQTLHLPGIGIILTFTMRGIKEAINQPHKHYLEKNLAIRDIQSLLRGAVLVKEEQDLHKEEYHYWYLRTYICDEESFIVLRENRFTRITDFYSIVDKIKE